MKRITLVAAGAAVLMFSTTALAQPNLSSRGTHLSSRNGTMARAIERVTINIAKNPQAPGLVNAQGRLVDNAEKHLANGNGPGPRTAGMEQPQGMERPQGVERPERPERPQVALSPSVVERPLPPGLADRPLPPGHARRR